MKKITGIVCVALLALSITACDRFKKKEEAPAVPTEQGSTMTPVPEQTAPMEAPAPTTTPQTQPSDETPAQPNTFAPGEPAPGTSPDGTSSSPDTSTEGTTDMPTSDENNRMMAPDSGTMQQPSTEQPATDTTPPTE